jgi:hypothetical protein
MKQSRNVWTQESLSNNNQNYIERSSQLLLLLLLYFNGYEILITTSPKLGVHWNTNWKTLHSQSLISCELH